MTKVAHMVCPDCARLHGQDHVDACPKVYEGESPEAYRRGWMEGSALIAAAFRHELEKERKRADEAEARVVAKLPELLERIQKEEQG